MKWDRLLAVVLPPVAAAIVGLYQAHVGAAKVESAEIQCGEIIAAIYGQLSPTRSEE